LKAGIALGSNLGNRAQHLERGFGFLRALSANGHFLRSSIVETAPVDCPPGSEAFLNAAAEIDFPGVPRRLFEQLKDFEKAEGRTAAVLPNAPRPLDLDLLYFGDQVIEDDDLAVPHPRLAARPFVLGPLAEIVPDLVLPGQHRTVRALADEIHRR